MWRSAVIGTTALGGLALAGWVSADQPVRAAVLDKSDQRVVATAPVPPGPKIQIAKHKYDRPTLTIPVGATVTWVNQDDDAHTVTADDGGFTSAGLDRGERGAAGHESRHLRLPLRPPPQNDRQDRREVTRAATERRDIMNDTHESIPLESRPE